MKKLALHKSLVVFSLISSLLVFAVSWANADHDTPLRANLTGFQEVPTIVTAGHGRFEATIGQATMTYRLEYANLEGGAVVGAHIHIGQPRVNGGIAIHLCGSGGKPPCPPSPAVLTGTVTAADVTGPANQGVSPGDAARVIHAITSGQTYANVHTTRYPGGEVRGQINGDRYQ